MGARGPISRKNLPRPLRIVDTEDTKHPRKPSAADLPAPVAPEAPHGLNAELLPLFEDTAAELDKAGLASKLDGMAIALAVTHYGAAMAAAEDLAADGSTVEGATGGSVVNPASTVLARHTDSFTELAKQLGLTFASRARIAIATPARDDIDIGNPFAPRAGDSTTG